MAYLIPALLLVVVGGVLVVLLMFKVLGGDAPFVGDSQTAAGDTPEHSDVSSDQDAASPATR